MRKKILVPSSVHTSPGKENSEKNSKNYKTSSRHYFKPKRDEIGRKSENNILVPNSVHARPGQENSERNSKKIQKIIKPPPGIIFIQNGMRYVEKKENKILVPNSVHTRPGKENSEENCKKLKKL